MDIYGLTVYVHMDIFHSRPPFQDSHTDVGGAMELVLEDLQCGAGRDWLRFAGDAVPRGIKRPAAALILSRLLFDAP